MTDLDAEIPHVTEISSITLEARRRKEAEIKFILPYKAIAAYIVTSLNKAAERGEDSLIVDRFALIDIYQNKINEFQSHWPKKAPSLDAIMNYIKEDLRSKGYQWIDYATDSVLIQWGHQLAVAQKLGEKIHPPGSGPNVV